MGNRLMFLKATWFNSDSTIKQCRTCSLPEHGCSFPECQDTVTILASTCHYLSAAQEGCQNMAGDSM